MSAFMVNKRHIDQLVTLAIEGPQGVIVGPGRGWSRPFSYYHDGTRTQVVFETADAVGQMLANENARSLASRYGDGPETVPTWAQGYRYSRPRIKMTPVEGLKAISCYDYQACESRDWVDTEAASFCDSLTRSLIGVLPGYDEAPWEWPTA